MYNKLIRVAKQNYLSDELQKNSSEPKKVWNILNKMAGKSAREGGVQEVLVNNELISDKMEISENFNKFYANIATDIASKINPPDVPPPTSKPMTNIPENKTFDMATRPLQQGELIKAIDDLAHKLSWDHNDLSMCFLKKIIPTIEKPLLYIFGKSLAQGIVPFKLKIAKVSPFFKGGDVYNVTNYRPISLLCNFAKILEKIVHTRLTSFTHSQKLKVGHLFFRSSVPRSFPFQRSERR